MFPSRSTSEPSTPGKHDLRDAGDGGRVGDAPVSSQGEEGDEGWYELPSHAIPSPPTTRSMSLIPMNGMRMPPSP